jgi:putative transposase
MKYYTQFILYNDIHNYLKDIFFEIGRMYFSDFDAICTDGDHILLYVDTEQQYFPPKIFVLCLNTKFLKVTMVYNPVISDSWAKFTRKEYSS